ncbi:ABC transporter substrate-binding protein [Chitinophaga polysaccharea]|uniref:heme/hemin ABC transporter substrate-binding protein n=1 Tax=Chitinophaga TaxID=79328 RepID=UPI0014557C1C|nr:MULTISPECIES: ABC transporter substrate-binding protein [Chitinophaga]NLR56907.1 ABC transporter substrate-binding protein [Chitinophaga polysaccharea]NLU93129.1 ABC transporter substrate-binding protein [Chitinophaga sp. Ak27]
MKKNIHLPWVMILLTSCGRFGHQPQQHNDSTRIVCLSKQYNEVIYALGAEKNLVAVDLSSTYPPAIKALPTVGYHRALSAEGLLAQNPTLVIHDNNIGPENVMRQLEKMKVPMKTFMDSVFTIAQTKAMIQQLGAYFHKEPKADSLCKKLDAEMNQALTNAHQYTDTPKVVIIHFGRAMNIYLALTQKSTAAQLIGWAGGRIPIDGDKGMQQVSAELIAQADPDVILLTDFGYDRLGTFEKIKELPGVSGTKAALHHRIYRIEEHDIVYLGPRTGANVQGFQKLIHAGK